MSLPEIRAGSISSAEARQLSDYELALAHVKDDLSLYSQTCLKILGKAGGANVPFVFNKAQEAPAAATPSPPATTITAPASGAKP